MKNPEKSSPFVDDRFPTMPTRKIPNDFPGMQPFLATKQPTLPALLHLVGFIPLLGFPILAYVVCRLFNIDIGYTVALTAFAFFSSAKYALVLTRWAILRNYRLQAIEDRQTLRASPSSIHVGIAYAPEIVFFQGNSNWDRGFLEISDGCVTFQGFGTRFVLPTAAINRVTIGKANIGITKLPRVFVYWTHPESGLNAFSLEVCDEKDYEQCVKKAARLLHQIHAQIGRTSPHPIEPAYPFESSKLNFEEAAVTRPDGY